MGHLPKTDDRCILLTADNIFYDTDIKLLLDKSGVRLERIKSAGAIRKEFSDHIFTAIREPWTKEMETIEADLNEQKEALGLQIEDLINAPGFDNALWVRAKVKKELNITAFNFIMTDLPDNLPPRSAYHRPEGSKVPISARATAEMQALVEHSEWTSVFGPSSDGPSSTPGLDHATLTEYLTVSIGGTVSQGRVTNFTVTSIEPSKP